MVGIENKNVLLILRVNFTFVFYVGVFTFDSVYL